jgi:predicted RND superfamily exporter protein
MAMSKLTENRMAERERAIRKDVEGSPPRSHLMTFGLDRLGLATLARPRAAAIVAIVSTLLALIGISLLKVDDSLSELFRTDTPEFRQYQEIDRRFPSSEYDVLAVVEGPDLLARAQLKAFSAAVVDLQLVDGVAGLVSMLSARGKPDATGYPPPIVPDELPEGSGEYDEMIKALRSNDIVSGKFLSDDGQLALIVLSLDREVVREKGAAAVIGGIREAAESALQGSGLSVKLTGAPVMQLEIRNAVERDQIVYNGLGLLFGAGIAAFFFRRLSLMLLAALPPVLAVTWSLGLLGLLGVRLNLFLNVMTPLVMVMGFADSMQMVAAIRIRLREGDSRREAIAFAVRVVGPACVLAHGTTFLAFIALFLSDSGLIRTFGAAGALATIVSYVAVLGILPVLGLVLIRNEDLMSRARAPVDAAMDALGAFVGWVVDRVVARPALYTGIGLALFLLFAVVHSTLQPRYRLADQVPDREQALAATSRIDAKLTGANPVHVMIQWKDGRSVYDPSVLGVIADAHAVLEKTAGLGNVWSIESLRRWLSDSGSDASPQTIKRYIEVLPEHLVRRFIDASGDAVLVTGRLPDVDSSQILPVVQKIDRALDAVRRANPGFEISVTGLPAIAARNSASMIQQLNHALLVEVIIVSLLIGIAFRSVFAGAISVLPGLFPVFAAGTWLALSGEGLEFASIVALVIIFGLAIDSLVHFLNRLRLEERPGEEASVSIRRARVLVGPAIILTTIVLAFGLGVTTFSDLPSLRLFGHVCAITLLASLVGDLAFLPATIALYRRYFPGRSSGI